jgi:hypothetical protein
MVSLGSCKHSTNPEQPALVSISVTRLPDKITYITGETFDPTGLEITGTYSDDTTKVETGYNLDTVDTTTTGTKNVTVSLNELIVTFTVTVSDSGSLGISIGFNLGAITITGSDGINTISRGADTSKPTSLTLSVSSAAGYTGVQWYVDGVLESGATGDNITLTAAAYDIRNHSVTFTGIKDGILYSQLIPFTVEQ